MMSLLESFLLKVQLLTGQQSEKTKDRGTVSNAAGCQERPESHHKVASSHPKPEGESQQEDSKDAAPKPEKDRGKQVLPEPYVLASSHVGQRVKLVDPVHWFLLKYRSRPSLVARFFHQAKVARIETIRMISH